MEQKLFKCEGEVRELERPEKTDPNEDQVIDALEKIPDFYGGANCCEGSILFYTTEEVDFQLVATILDSSGFELIDFKCEKIP